jgi:hypothetical protein
MAMDHGHARGVFQGGARGGHGIVALSGHAWGGLAPPGGDSGRLDHPGGTKQQRWWPWLGLVLTRPGVPPPPDHTSAVSGLTDPASRLMDLARLSAAVDRLGGPLDGLVVRVHGFSIFCFLFN